VVTAFKATGRRDPRLDAHGSLDKFLQRQIKGYTNTDPGVKSQQTLPKECFAKFAAVLAADMITVVAQELMVLSFFFALRSCEAFLVPRSEQKRTRCLQKQDFIFMKNHRVVPHSSPFLAMADSVTIKFHFQKNNKREETVTQMATDDPLMCPVKMAAAIVQRLDKAGAEPTFIYQYRTSISDKWRDLKSKTARGLFVEFLRVGVDFRAMGIDLDRVGMHSARTSAAMAMYMSEVPVFTIMLLGRWNSDAFLRYIRKEVEEFGQNVSQKMINTLRFHSVPELSRDDTRAPNDPRSFATRHGAGVPAGAAGGAGGSSRAFRVGGAFSVWG
jgi:hypothetical protein